MTIRPEAPARPDAAGGVRPGRRWLPAIAVALVIAVTVLGGFVVAGALPAPDVRAVTVADVVTIRPVAGWEVSSRDRIAIPLDGATVGGEFVQLTRGSGALDVLAFPAIGGEPERLAELYAEEVLSSQLARLSVSRALRPVTLPGGVEGVRFGYVGSAPDSGTAIEGSVVAAVSASGHGVVFDGWGDEGQLELIAEEVAATIATLEIP